MICVLLLYIFSIRGPTHLAILIIKGVPENDIWASIVDLLKNLNVNLQNVLEIRKSKLENHNHLKSIHY